MWIENVLGAADAVFQLKNMLLMTVGVLAGLIAGAIPGFTITMAVAGPVTTVRCMATPVKRAE
ncbi:MAG: hypothetical protein RLN80_11935 [Rhodospirillales bacterium]